MSIIGVNMFLSSKGSPTILPKVDLGEIGKRATSAGSCHSGSFTGSDRTLTCFMETPGTLLNAAVAHAMPMLQRITDAEASKPLSPGKWCTKELIGHLLDSANINLDRFVRLQATDHLLFEPYAQDVWVEAQGYATADWAELVELWARINRHIARVMDRVPEGPLFRPRTEHRPLGTTFAPLPPDGLPTLEWLMRDYVEHLKHHLRQIGPGVVG